MKTAETLEVVNNLKNKAMDESYLTEHSIFNPTSIGVLAGENPSAQHTTCTWEIASNHFPDTKIAGYHSFEKAVEGLKNGVIKSVPVPGAYPQMREFTYDVDIFPAYVFLQLIPPIVLVTKSNKALKNKITTLYTHPAPRKLAETMSFQQIKECISNERVCEALPADEDNCAAGITNEVAAKFFDLHISKVLHP